MQTGDDDTGCHRDPTSDGDVDPLEPPSHSSTSPPSSPSMVPGEAHGGGACAPARDDPVLAPVRSSLSLSDPPLDDEHADDVHDADEEDNNDRTALDRPRRTSALPSSPPKEPLERRPRQPRDPSELDGAIITMDLATLLKLILQIPCSRCLGGTQLADERQPVREGAVWTFEVECTICHHQKSYRNHPGERLYPNFGFGNPRRAQRRRKRRTRQRNEAWKKKSPVEREAAELKAEVQEMIQGSAPRKCSGKGVYPINLRLAAGALLGGLRHSQFRDFGRVTGMDVFSSRTLEELAPRVWAAAEAVAQRELRSRVLKKGWTSFVIAVDGAWSQRRNARHHCLVVLDADNHEPLCIIPLSKWRWGVTRKPDEKEPNKWTYERVVRREGNYDGHSNGMEGHAWGLAAEFLNSVSPGICNQIRTICTDQDVNTAALAKHYFPRAVIRHDAGHFFKNAKKRLDAKGYGTRQPLQGISHRAMKQWNRCRHEALEAAKAERPLPTKNLPYFPSAADLDPNRQALGMSTATDTAAAAAHLRLENLKPSNAPTPVSRLAAKAGQRLQQDEDKALLAAKRKRQQEKKRRNKKAKEKEKRAKEKEKQAKARAKAKAKAKEQKIKNNESDDDDTENESDDDDTENESSDTTEGETDSDESDGDKDEATAPPEEKGMTNLPPMKNHESLDNTQRLAIDHFRIRLRYMYWHYLDSECLPGCPFDHANLGESVKESATAPPGAGSVTNDRGGGALSRNDRDLDAGSAAMDTDDDGTNVTRRSGKGRRIHIADDDSEAETKEHKGEAERGETKHSEERKGRKSPEPRPFSKATSRKNWIPLTDHSAVLTWHQVLRQIDRDCAKVIHPWSTTHVEGFHDLRYALSSSSSFLSSHSSQYHFQDQADSEAERILVQLEWAMLRNSGTFDVSRG